MIFSFWIVLAGLFLALAISSWFFSRKVSKNLDTYKKSGETPIQIPDDNPSINIPFINDIIDSLNISYKINFIGFVLAAGAAVLSAIPT